MARVVGEKVVCANEDEGGEEEEGSEEGPEDDGGAGTVSSKVFVEEGRRGSRGS